MTEDDNARVIITEPGVLEFGLPTRSNVSSFFRDETVVQVSCGSDHSAVVCESGRVYTFRTDQDNAEEPTIVDTLSTVRVTQVACGEQFTVYLTDGGRVYVCGRNDQGQLGLGHTDNVPVPVLVTGLPSIKKVSAGLKHTVVLAKHSDVWASGNNGYGQLGLGHKNDQNVFTLVLDLPEPIIDIACGGYHTALISASRVLLTSGWNKHGQRGLRPDHGSLSNFKPVLVPSTAVAAVSCGGYHTVVLGMNGTTWAWGYNGGGQLGTGDTLNRCTPTKVIGLEDQTVSRVIAGLYHTAVLTHEGDVLMCGNGEDGELGLENLNLLTVTLLRKSPGLIVQQVAFARTYSLVLVIPISKLQVGTTEEGDRANHCPTDLERIIMRSLECPVCFKIMYAPIHMCIKGHSLCGSCRSDNNTTVCPLCREQFSVARNITMESLMMEMVLPCAECMQRMPASLLEEHGLVCPAREYGCPVPLVSGRCGWAGRPETMLAHASSAHPDRTWTHLPHVFLHSTSDRLLRTDLLAAHGRVFTLHRRYDGQEFRAAVRYIGPPDNSHKFKFEFTFITDFSNISNTYFRNVCADIECVEDAFQSSSKCVSMKKDIANTFLQQGHLVCRVTILKVKNSGLSDQIKDLLSEVGGQGSSR